MNANRPDTVTSIATYQRWRLEKQSELTGERISSVEDHIMTRCRNGLRYHDPEVKPALIRQAAIVGAIIPASARECGITASQLQHWIRQYR